MAVTQDESSGDNHAWLYGLRLIEHGYFWEAHEILESVWMRASPNSRERQLVQGIIHIANAALKQTMARPGAAKRLYLLAQNCVLEAFPGRRKAPLMGLEFETLLSATTRQSPKNLSHTK